MSRPPRPLDPFEAIAAALDIDAGETAMLREQCRRDPIRGAPMYVKLSGGDGEPEPIEPGQWRNIAYYDETGQLPANCPVTPLGMDEKACYFLSPLGHVRTLGETAGKSPIIFLFGGRTAFLEWAWPRFGRARAGDKTAPVAGFAAEDALPALVNACALKGSFALEDQVRGRGAWRDDDGSLIYHAGDAVWIGGAWRPCGEYGRHIYPARPRLGRPSARFEPEGEGSPGDALLEVLRTFNWDRGELDARLTLGWLMTAKVGGALNRRPVGFVTGEEGSGKSTLQELLRLAMNGALLATSNTTQAGIYQRIRQDSVAIMVDEMEAKDDSRVSDKILELARICYSGDKMQRGGKDGEGKEFALKSSFMGSSIAKPATDAQDDSRMFVGILRPLEIDRAGDGRAIDALTISQWAQAVDLDSPIAGADVERWGRELLRRWFEWWPRWDALLRVFRHALQTAGHDNRSADTFGPLAAACHVALHDDLPTTDQLAWWLEQLKASELTETATKTKTWKRCFLHLLEAQPETLRNGAIRSIGEVLRRWRDDPNYSYDDIQRILSLNDLALSYEAGDLETFDNARLFVPASSPALHALFQGSPWAGRPAAPGPWLGVLRQAPRDLWRNGKCDKGLDRKKSGVFIRLKAALDV